ncbi:MAG: hypothetical protein JNM20_06920 [Rhizobiales bacterium]|nr:hypothetical protein [Hyphomicrobiales bacterium]
MALRLTAPITLAAALLAVAACSGPNTKDVAIVSGKDSSVGAKPQPIRTLSQAEIDQVLTGRTFQYTLPSGDGIISFAPAGKFSFQDDAKGEGTGTWMAAEGQLCMRFGTGAEDCAEFKTTGDAYQVGKRGRLIEMKIE